MTQKLPGTSNYTELCFSCIAKSDDDYEPDLLDYHDLDGENEYE